MISLVDLEIYNSIFITTEENNNLEIYKFPDSWIGGISYEKVRDDIENNLEISENTASDLQDNLIGPGIIDKYTEQVIKRMEDGAYMNILAGYHSSVFQDSQSFLRTEIDLVEDDNVLVLDKDNSSFITYELEPGIYNFEDLSKALFNILQPWYPQSNSKIDI